MSSILVKYPLNNLRVGSDLMDLLHHPVTESTTLWSAVGEGQSFGGDLVRVPLHQRTLTTNIFTSSGCLLAQVLKLLDLNMMDRLVPLPLIFYRIFRNAGRLQQGNIHI